MLAGTGGHVPHPHLPGSYSHLSWAWRSAQGAAGPPRRTSPCLEGQRSATGLPSACLPTPGRRRCLPPAPTPRDDTVASEKATLEQLLLQPVRCLFLLPLPGFIQPPPLEPGEKASAAQIPAYFATPGRQWGPGSCRQVPTPATREGSEPHCPLQLQSALLSRGGCAWAHLTTSED